MRSKFILILMGSVFCISSSFAMETDEKERSDRSTPFHSSQKSQLIQYLEAENYDSAQGYCNKKSRELKQQAERQQDPTKLEISALFKKASQTLGTCSREQFEQLKSTGFEALLKDITPYLMENNVPFTDQDVQMFDVSCLRHIKEGLKSSPQKSLNSSSEKSEQQSSTYLHHMEAYSANTRLIGLIDEMMPFVARKNIADIFSRVERLDVCSPTREVSLLISPYIEEIMHCGQVLRCFPHPVEPEKLSEFSLHVKKYFKENCPETLSARVKENRLKVPKEEFLRYAELFFSFQQETPYLYQLLEATSASAAEMFKEEQNALKPQQIPRAYKEIYIAIMRNYLGGEENLWERTRNWTFVAYVKMLHQRFVEKEKK